MYIVHIQILFTNKYSIHKISSDFNRQSSELTKQLNLTLFYLNVDKQNGLPYAAGIGSHATSFLQTLPAARYGHA